jgi:hypothetical protein
MNALIHGIYTGPNDTRALKCDSDGQLLVSVVAETPSPVKAYAATFATNGVAYSAEDVVGTVVALDVSELLTEFDQDLELETLVLIDTANQRKACKFLFFSTDPTGVATITNNVGFAYGTDAMQQAQIGRVNVVPGDYETTDSRADAAFGLLGQVMAVSGSGTIWVVMIVKEAASYNSKDVIVKFGFKKS